MKTQNTLKTVIIIALMIVMAAATGSNALDISHRTEIVSTLRQTISAGCSGTNTVDSTWDTTRANELYRILEDGQDQEIFELFMHAFDASECTLVSAPNSSVRDTIQIWLKKNDWLLNPTGNQKFRFDYGVIKAKIHVSINGAEFELQNTSFIYSISNNAGSRMMVDFVADDSLSSQTVSKDKYVVKVTLQFCKNAYLELKNPFNDVWCKGGSICGPLPLIDGERRRIVLTSDDTTWDTLTTMEFELNEN